MESTVDNRVAIRSCSRQHVFDLFAKFSVFGYRIRPLNGQQLPTIALQHSGAPLTELVWACRPGCDHRESGLEHGRRFLIRPANLDGANPNVRPRQVALLRQSNTIRRSTPGKFYKKGSQEKTVPHRLESFLLRSPRD
jgi:hypothetical protein